MFRCFIFLALFVVASHADDYTVKTQYGDVEGMAGVNGVTRVWRGIPFGAPPTGDLRFAAPTAPKSWSDPLKVQADADACIQACELPAAFCPPSQSEDCLYLNIFSPPTSAGTDLPVLVFIHGGNFKQGYAGGTIYDYEKMANQTNTVIVAIQYRLGALGFLTTQDLAGNYGYLDQRFGLQWIQKNIAGFGGDPTKVTISGQSAGGCSTLMHLVDKKSAGLYRAVVMESIACLSLPLREVQEAITLGNVVLKKIGCRTTDDIDCLRNNVTAHEILDAQLAAETDLIPDLSHLLELFEPFEPTIGTSDTSITKQLITHLQEGDWPTDIPVMMGTVTEETVPFVYAAFPNPMNGVEGKALVETIWGPKDGSKILKQYPNDTLTKDIREDLITLTTDFLFTCVGRNASQVMQKASPTGSVWLYQFGHISPEGQEVWGDNYTECWDRCCHASEVPFIWNTAQEVSSTTDEEVQLGNWMSQYLANFANTMNPNQGMFTDLPTWNAQGKPGDSTFLYFDVTSAGGIVNQENVRASYCDFWDELATYGTV